MGKLRDGAASACTLGGPALHSNASGEWETVVSKRNTGHVDDGWARNHRCSVRFIPEGRNLFLRMVKRRSSLFRIYSAHASTLTYGVFCFIVSHSDSQAVGKLWVSCG